METLEIKSLGPISHLNISPKTLTLLVGPQASGKSLAAQVLFFFRTLHSELARRLDVERVSDIGWENEVMKEILDDLRGEPFGYYANGKALLCYGEVGEYPYNWKVEINDNTKSVTSNSEIIGQLNAWIELWSKFPGVSGAARRSSEYFLPTERSIFTRFFEKEASLLYADYQPLTFRRFADVLNAAKDSYRLFLQGKKNIGGPLELDLFHKIGLLQQEALAGKSYVPIEGPQKWEFRIGEGDQAKTLPLSLLASGQTEAWPFFALAATYGLLEKKSSFFFEEPETHLHPKAQRIVMETIALLVNNGRRFFLTTHSPFILYKINNMLQAFYAYKGNPPGDVQCLNPAEVSAYRIADGKAFDMMDKETGLLDTEELDKVADELGGEFDKYLFMKEPANG